MKNRLAITLLVIFVSHLLVFDIWGYWMVYGPYPKPLVVCKVCHCGKEKCNRVCSEENMCALRCESACGRKR